MLAPMIAIEKSDGSCPTYSCESAALAAALSYFQVPTSGRRGPPPAPSSAVSSGQLAPGESHLTYPGDAFPLSAAPSQGF